jgi:hypothetical protein
MTGQAAIYSSQKVGLRMIVRSTARPSSVVAVSSSKRPRIGYGARVTPVISSPAPKDVFRPR